MSEQPSLVDARLGPYLAAHARGDDDFLVALKSAAAAQGIPPIWIAPEQAAFVAILLGAIGAREVVEVGTLAGYAAIRMARALGAQGRVRTLELSRKHAAFAREWIARSDVAGRVEVIEGDARTSLAALAARSVDLVLVDADKGGYPAYLEQAARILRPGGIVLVDNAFAFGQLFDEQPSDPDVPAVRAFNEQMARRTEFESAILPLGDGLWIGRRI
ncbi:MAG: O-methyltransferase [Planctomycetes bacterium]|nr:O-methyltransferase [Planctomycetota bacterium]